MMELIAVKIVTSFMLIIAICISLMCPVFAAQDDFVDSITYKPGPELVGEKAEDGCYIVGHVYDADNKCIADIHYRREAISLEDNAYSIGLYVYEDITDGGDHVGGTHGEEHTCLVITPVANAETSSMIPEDARELLLWVYDQILAQGMSFFADCEGLADVVAAALGEDATVEDLVVKELFDVSVLCEELETYLDPEGTTLCLDFDFGIEPGTFVEVVAYKDGKWERIEKVEFAEDGSYLCTTYEDFCPVAVLVPAVEVGPDADVVPDTGDQINGQAVLWSVIAGASLVAIVVLLLVQRKRSASGR